MLKRVPKEEIRLGMFVHSLEGNWLDHPFWRTKFLLQDPDDLEALRASNIAAILIDEEKGTPACGDAPGTEVAGAVAPPAELDACAPAPQRAPVRPAPRSAPAPAPLAAVPRDRSPCGFAEEYDRAAALAEHSRRAVRKLFGQARLGKPVDLIKVAPVVEEIAASVDRNPSAMITVTRLRDKDEYTYLHSVAVCALMVNLARYMGMEDARVREAGLAGLLHDIGKVAVPAAVLNKPGGLTEQEYSIVRRHPERGRQLLDAAHHSEIVRDVCLHHHEKMDGTGYPDGLKGEEISIFARMCAVCDVYDAITSNRPYKEAAAAAESISNMFRWGGHFDPKVLAAFIRSVGIYPVGTLVRLQSDRLGVVIDQCRSDSVRPIVHVFYCIATRARLPGYDLDLSKEAARDRIVGREEPAKWGFASWESHWLSFVRASGGRAEAA